MSDLSDQLREHGPSFGLGHLCDEAADALDSSDARIAELEAQLATVAPAVDAQPVAWMLEWTHSGEVREQRLYDDECHCLLDAETNGGVCVPLGRIVSSAQSEGLRKDAIRRAALEEVTQEVRAIDEACTGASMQVNVLRAIRALAQREGEKT